MGDHPACGLSCVLAMVNGSPGEGSAVAGRGVDPHGLGPVGVPRARCPRPGAGLGGVDADRTGATRRALAVPAESDRSAHRRAPCGWGAADDRPVAVTMSAAGEVHFDPGLQLSGPLCRAAGRVGFDHRTADRRRGGSGTADRQGVRCRTVARPQLSGGAGRERRADECRRARLRVLVHGDADGELLDRASSPRQVRTAECWLVRIGEE